MTRISVELVPRSIEAVLAEAGGLAEHAPWADTINIPDLTRFELRAWDACAEVLGSISHPSGGAYRTIPHIRAVDFDPDQDLPFVATLLEHGIDEVVVISGDDGEWFRPSYPVDAVDVVRRLKGELPELTVWAGLDPYRQGIADELRYVQRKIAAGAQGLFTQPFFDLNLVRSWASVLPRDLPVWWGATTVTTPASMGYWRRRNLAAFPTDFQLTLEWQRNFAQSLIREACEMGQNVYLMPVRTSTADYLSGIEVPEN